MKKYERFILYTNRNIMVLDHSGNQVPEAQGVVSCYDIDKAKAQAVVDQCLHHYIARWSGIAGTNVGAFIHKVTKQEMEYLLGLRTREMDTTVVHVDTAEEAFNVLRKLSRKEDGK